MDGGDLGVQGQRADQQGILYPTWAFRKELLLLAKEASHKDCGRSSGAGIPWKDLRHRPGSCAFDIVRSN